VNERDLEPEAHALGILPPPGRQVHSLGRNELFYFVEHMIDAMAQSLSILVHNSSG
jgi:hypothetical protein